MYDFSNKDGVEVGLDFGNHGKSNIGSPDEFLRENE